MINGEKKIARPLRWGMVGGGRTGQVGYKHRTGALRDGTYQLLAGAFDLDAARGRDFGTKLGVAADRCYDTYQDLIAGEAAREDGVEVVSIATPNFTHFEITKACLEAGLHVICEKPLFFTVAECEEVAALASDKGLIVGVTYGFTGHPLVHQMAAMVKKGLLGEIRIVDMQYTHGFNSGDDVGAGEAVKWRTNPETAGPTFVLGDIGTHLYYLSEVVLPHLKIEKLLCDRKAFIASNEVDSGTLQTQEVCRLLDGKGKVLVLMGALTDQAGIQRTKDIHDVIKTPECSGMEVVAEESGEWQRTKGNNIMTNWLSSGLEFDAVIANNDEMAIGAIQAMKAVGADMDKIVVAGIDATQDALQAMKAGDLDVTVFQDAAGQGRGAIDTAVKLVKGEDVDQKVWVPFQLVTPANMDEYINRN